MYTYMTIQIWTLYVGAKCNTHIMTLIHTICESTNVYLHDNLNMHTICGGKTKYLHHDPNPHYIWEH
jgi:hypothetical protein